MIPLGYASAKFCLLGEKWKMMDPLPVTDGFKC